MYYYNYNDRVHGRDHDLVSLLLLLGPSAVITADCCDSGVDFHYKVCNICLVGRGALGTYKSCIHRLRISFSTVIEIGY
jgi:hypothetical protein